MENAQNQQITKIIRLSRFLFDCPKAKHMLIVMLIAAVLFLVVGTDIFSRLGYFVFLILPAAISSAFSWQLVQKLGGTFKDKHAYFVSTISMVSIAFFLTIADFVEKTSMITEWSTVQFLFVWLSALFMFNLLIYATIGNLPLWKSSIPSLMYPLLSVLILFTFKTITIENIFSLAKLFAVSYVIIWLFIKATNIPFEKALGISTLDLIRLAVSEYIVVEDYKNPFKSIGREVSIPHQAVLFRTKNKKILLSVPWLHPGPTGSLGGKLPFLIKRALQKNFDDVIFLHTYVDSSFNPVFPENATSSIKEIVLNRIFSKKFYTSTRAIRLEKNGLSLLGQKIGNFYLIFSTFSPAVTEDISSGIGFLLHDKLGKKALFIDAHNSISFDSELDSNVNFGDEKAALLVESISTLVKKLDSEKQFKFRIGIKTSEKDFWAIGIRSISILVLEAGNSKTAYAVLDANNLSKGFREHIIGILSKAGFENSEIITTDAHLEEYAMRMSGKIGIVDRDELASEISSLAKHAVSGLENAHASYLCKDFNAKIFGEKTMHQLVAVAHSIVPFAKFLAVTLFGIFLLAAYFILSF